MQKYAGFLFKGTLMVQGYDAISFKLTIIRKTLHILAMSTFATERTI